MIPDALRTAAADRLPDGTRRLVVIVGAGLNAAAVSGSDVAGSWEGLLGLVQDDLRRHGVALPDSLPVSGTARWEALLRAVAASRPDLPPAGAERLLRNAVAGHLRTFEARAPQHPRFAEVLDWGVRDIISLNFDLSLVRAGGSRRLSHAVGPAKLRRARRRLGRNVSNDPTLYRRAELPRAAGTTRIWFPHGDTARAESLKLGIYTYGRSIAALECAVGVFHREKRKHSDAGSGAWVDALRDLPEGSLSWATILLGSPLMFVGVRLSYDEWPLWWLMHRRARLHARTPPEKQPGAWILMREHSAPNPVPSHLVGSPAGLEVVSFDEYDAVWDGTDELFAK